MTTALKNLYEDLIQEMIINGIDGMNDELKELIQNAPVEKRRAMILTILEENNVEHRLLCNRIEKTVNTSNYSEMNHIKGVVSMLREYVKVSKTEVKTMGEVMTPINLVEEMLDTLPYEVWSNPNLKWLDPCNGVGTFFSVVIERLMKGLEEFEPNEQLRYKHIVENMIYACELQPKNLFLFMYAFDPKDEYAMNVYCGSYLDEGFDNHMNFWGVDKFDIVVMNPPYQELKEGNKASTVLWNKFVTKTISQLVEGGYLVAVHPSGWRNVDGVFKNVQLLLRSKQMVYLEIHNGEDGIKTFGATTRYDFYCLHNIPNTMFTKIKCEDGSVERADISKMEFIPNSMFKEIQKLIAKDGEERVELLYSRSAYGHDKNHMSKVKTEEHIYPCAQNINSKSEIGCFYYSNTNENGHFGVPKLIFGRFGTNSFIDENGEFGVSDNCSAFVDTVDNLKRIKEALGSEDFKLINKMLNVSGNNHKTLHYIRINYSVISSFRKDWWISFL